MPPAAPPLPTKFPCWCKAIYSWGGETKRDLGFIEGDLIECLNAGDGQWWMGRLKRDRRAVGLFPSNFVELLDESQWPGAPRSSTANAGGMSRSGTNAAAQKPVPQKQKSTFRKPFQAYYNAGQPNPVAHARERQEKSGTSGHADSQRRHKPYSSMKHAKPPGPSPNPSPRNSIESVARIPPLPERNASNLRNLSPAPPQPADYRASPRAVSPGPPQHYRAPSPAPPQQYRAASPAPPQQYRAASPAPPQQYRATSPAPQQYQAYSRGPSPSPYQQQYYPPSPGMHPTTPRQQYQAYSPSASPGPDSQQYYYRSPSRGPSPAPFEDEIGEASPPPPPPPPHRVLHSQANRAPSPSPYQMSRSPSPAPYNENGYRSGYHTPTSHSPVPRQSTNLTPSPVTNAMNDVMTSLEDMTVAKRSPSPARARTPADPWAPEAFGRTFTTKTNATNSTEATNSTGHTLWSGTSAGANSATSSGSFARRKWGIGGTIREHRERSKSVVEVSRPRAGSIVGSLDGRPDSPFSGEGGGPLGGLTSPKPKRTGFFKKMISSAKANAANARNTISSSPSRPASRGAGILPAGVTSIAGGSATFRPSSTVAKEMGMGGSVDWVQVRRDVNRSNSLSKNERIERAERCQMNDIIVINPIEVLLESIEGDEGLDGLPVPEPLDFSQCNLGLVDKNTRFIQGLPPMTTPASLAQGYVCRPYRSDVQRLRAIFTWVSERIAWEEDFEGDVDTRRVIQSKRGCSEEIAVLVMDMCAAVGLHSEVIRGYLKAPGEELDFEMIAHPNHWWNAVIVDGEWRIMDCSLANPTNPRRSSYSSAGSQVAESGFFLAPQHIIPPLSHEVLMALPCACPPYFMNDIEIADFDTSLLNLENLEMAHIHFFVPEDVEAVAEVEARIFARDGDGDFFESGETCRKRALCQPEWIGGRKRYTVKALLPGDEGHATLKVYAGKKGLMHSIKSNPHPLVFALPLTHVGQNPPYEFVTLHPTPHAQRHDLYVAQPQCARLAVNNTFVFAVRQHPSSLTWTNTPSGPNHMHSQSTSSAMLSGRISPNPFARPNSALSMVSASASNAGSVFSASSSGSDPLMASKTAPGASQKPAKLAIQSPSGKIIRLMRKSEHMIANSHGAGVGGASDGEREGGDGSVWETIIKIGERGTWRGLVLADRSARWCVFAEWESF
ncbi:Cytokinesis protein cyk3 [Lasiodiplodia theobromae]|uniref:Cytokinesis protein cyk3 n=1 Tax=Lasiodiplodia theobromae TaxID=45133 RepID=UPI0015C3E265|nr:Cytokinesis protein cyk3 [Lasiodiplodia theobromae]KAF4544105.1 Cytokinesis protein cyk3 [Lasiodiplodia theobromae]